MGYYLLPEGRSKSRCAIRYIISSASLGTYRAVTMRLIVRIKLGKNCDIVVSGQESVNYDAKGNLSVIKCI